MSTKLDEMPMLKKISRVQTESFSDVPTAESEVSRS